MKRTNEHQTIVTHAYIYSVIDDMLTKFPPQKQLPGAIWKWFLAGVRITDPELFLRLLIQQ